MPFFESRTRFQHGQDDAGHGRLAPTGADRLIPLRIKVLHVLLEELLARVQKLQKTPLEDALVKTLLQHQYVTLNDNARELNFPFLHWNPELKKLELNMDQTPLTMTHVTTQLTRILTLLQNHAVIVRFSALRPNAQIQQHMTKPTVATPQVIPWRLSLSMNHKYSLEMHSLWQELAFSGLWQLILGRMRPASLQRTPLAGHLGRMLETL